MLKIDENTYVTEDEIAVIQKEERVFGGAVETLVSFLIGVITGSAISYIVYITYWTLK